MIRTVSEAPLAIALKQSEYAVFLGGAGVSTECGISDFRSKNGIFQKMASTVLNSNTIKENPDLFWRNYREHLLPDPKIEPGVTHKVLARLETQGKIKSILTQNIDGLHQKAGSKNVLELHGSANKNYCLDCDESYNMDYILSSKAVPKCHCGGTIRPDIVLYGEYLNDNIFRQAVEEVRKCDLFIIGGTSMMVNPISSLLALLQPKAFCIMINESPTEIDKFTNVVINRKIQDIFSSI